jgi:hypothetical protein
VLVAKLVEKLRPGITSSTDGLSKEATSMIMAYVKDLLDGAEEDIKAQQVGYCDISCMARSSLRHTSVAARDRP